MRGQNVMLQNSANKNPVQVKSFAVIFNNCGKIFYAVYEKLLWYYNHKYM